VATTTAPPQALVCDSPLNWRVALLHIPLEAAQHAPSLQEAAQLWLRQIMGGSLQLKLDTSGFDSQIEAVRGITRTVVAALVLIGLLVASAIASTASLGGGWKHLQTFAMVSYVVAAIIAGVAVLVLGRRILHRTEGA
jgi:hypothetical protein